MAWKSWVMGVYNKWMKFLAQPLGHAGTQGFLLIINGFVNFVSIKELSIVPSASVRFGQAVLIQMTTGATTRTDETEMDVEDSDFKPLSAEQAQQLREANPEPSPWWVIVAQVVAGFLVAGIAWVWTGRLVAGVSALYGALAVAIPAALFVRGAMRAAKRGTQEAGLASAAMLRFFVWELIKLGSTIAFLAAAPWVVGGLNWLALVAGVVAAMKMYWVALVVRPRLLNRF